MHKANTATTAAGHGFNSALAKLGSHTKASPESQETIQAYIPFAMEIEGLRARYTEALSELLLEPLSNIVTHEVHSANTLLTKLDIDRLDLDNKKQKIMENEGKPENDFGKVASQARFEDAQATYDKTKADLSAMCAAVESQKNNLLQNNLVEFLRVQGAFFDDCRGTLGVAVEDPTVPDSPRSCSDWEKI
jgi:hypothetical protein